MMPGASLVIEGRSGSSTCPWRLSAKCTYGPVLPLGSGLFLRGVLAIPLGSGRSWSAWGRIEKWTTRAGFPRLGAIGGLPPEPRGYFGFGRDSKAQLTTRSRFLVNKQQQAPSRGDRSSPAPRYLSLWDAFIRNTSKPATAEDTFYTRAPRSTYNRNPIIIQ